MEKWVQSLTTQPLMLHTNMGLVPLSYYVEKKNRSAAENIDLASRELFIANLKYIQPPIPPPREEVQAPPQQSSGCLKVGTLIQLSDGRKLPVETIRSGDMVLDINLKSCKVVGVNHMFMDGKRFYGFSKNNCFFTGGHIFAHSKSDEFFVVSKRELLKDNPFIDDLKVVEVQPGQKIEALKINGDSETKTIVAETVTVFEDEIEYDAAVPVYFLIVENETGTYIANDYVCRHELPRFERWPNTLACLQKIVTSNMVKRNSVGKKLSLLALREMEKTVDHIAKELEKEFSSKCGTFLNDITNREHGSISVEYMVADLSLYLATVTEMIHDNYWSTFAMLIYGRCGNLIRDVLDNQKQATVSSSLLADFIIRSLGTFAINN
jgi:hypothetical protein